MFDRVVVISLRRRQHRLVEFQARLAQAWPGVECTVFDAVDGRAEAAPPGWKTTPGAWGCLRSHAGVLEQAAAESLRSVLVFEDDATFLKGFAERLGRLEIPADCEQLYLGGQHLRPPRQGPPGLVRGINVNRTHAYAIIGRQAIARLCDHLRFDPATWKEKHHVDHRYGSLHESGMIGVYAVKPWICGQAAGTSDVDCKKWPARCWS